MHMGLASRKITRELLSSFLFVAFNQIRNANTMQEIKKERCCDACFVKVL